MKKRYGFTLSEILLAVGILGLLIAFVTPAIVKVSPSVDKTMARQAYYTITTTVSDMINNPLFYSFVDNSGTVHEGFDNHDSITYKGKTYSGTTKFAKLFVSHLNVKGSESSSSSYCSAFSGGSDCTTVYTTNGQRWSLYAPSAIDELAAKIFIDLNGDKGPNCYVGKTGDICNDPDIVYDQFRVNVYDNGRVVINPTDTWAVQAIKSTGSIVD